MNTIVIGPQHSCTRLIVEDKFDKIRELMIEVKDNHTYINRINFIFTKLNYI